MTGAAASPTSGSSSRSGRIVRSPGRSRCSGSSAPPRFESTCKGSKPKRTSCSWPAATARDSPMLILSKLLLGNAMLFAFLRTLGIRNSRMKQGLIMCSVVSLMLCN